MAKRTIRDRRLTGDDNLTNILSGTATTGTGQVEQQDQQGVISGVPKDATAPGAAAPTTTQSAQQQNQQQAQQQQAKIATKAPKQPARSGMFTNIKQYMEKNKPVIEKMGQQAGSQFATTAEKIRQQADIQQKSYQERLKESQEAVESQLTGGQQAIESALQTTPVKTATEVPETQETEVTTPVQPEVEQPATLADYGKAAENLAASASALDLEEQIKEASKLQRQASGILSDAGRRDLLRDVFGRGTRQYTSGSQALDNLLLAASPEAGKRLKETVTSASRRLEDIARQQQAGTQAFQELQKQAAGVGDILGRQSEQALQQQFGDIETSTQQFKEERKAYLQSGVKKAMEDINKTTELQNKILDYTVKNDGFGESFFKNLGFTTRIGAKKWNSIPIPTLKKNYEDQNLKYVYGDFDSFLNLLKEKGARMVEEDTEFKYELAIPGIQAREFVESLDLMQQLNPDKAIETTKYPDIPYLHPILRKEIEDKTGTSYYDIMKNADIEEGKYYGYSDEEIARINALKKLQGRTDFITPSEEYASLEDLQLIKDLINPPRNVGVVKPSPFRKK